MLKYLHLVEHMQNSKKNGKKSRFPCRKSFTGKIKKHIYGIWLLEFLYYIIMLNFCSEVHEHALLSCDAFHHERRILLKQEIGRMVLFFTDQPSLLAPNIQVRIYICISKTSLYIVVAIPSD